MSQRIIKWKRVLAIMLTLAMLTQNCYSVIAASIDGTAESEQTMVLLDEGDSAAPGTEDEGSAGGDEAGNSDAGQGNTDKGTDIGQDDAADGGNDIGGDSDAAGDGTDISGNEEDADGSGNEGNNGEGDISDGNGSDGSDDDAGNDESNGADSGDSGENNNDNQKLPEKTSTAELLFNSKFIEKITYEYQEAEGTNPWEGKLAVNSVQEAEIPDFNNAQKVLLNKEFYQIGGEAEGTLPELKGVLHANIELTENQTLYFYNGSQYQEITAQTTEVRIPERNIFGFVLAEEKVFTLEFGNGDAAGSDISGSVTVSACDGDQENTSLKIEELSADNEYVANMGAALENADYRFWSLSLVNTESQEAVSGTLNVNVSFNPELWSGKTNKTFYRLNGTELAEAAGSENNISFETTDRTVFGVVAKGEEAKTYDISRGAPYVNWIDAEESDLYYKENGKWVSYASNSEHKFASGDEIKVNIAYKVEAGVTIHPGDKIVYNLDMGDTGAVIYGQTNIPITLKGDSSVIGHFDIGNDGLITVEYDSQWLTDNGNIEGRNNISTVLEASGKLNFKDSGDDNNNKYIYIGDIKLEIKVKEKDKNAVVNVNKFKDADSVARKIDADGNVTQIFKVRITAPKTNTIPIKTLHLTDSFSKNGKYATYLEESLKVVSKPARLNVFLSSIQIDESKKQMDFDIQIANPQDEEDGLGAVEGEEFITVSYAVKFDKSIWYDSINGNNVSTSVRNTVKVINENVSGTTSDYEDVSFSKTWLSKKGSVIRSTDGQDALIRYNVHINNKPTVDIKGWTIRDTLQEASSVHFYKKDSIKVIKHIGDEQEIVKNFTLGETAEGRQYVEFTADGAYYYELQYDTNVSLTDSQTSAELKNKIEMFRPGETGTGSGPSYINGVSYDVFTIKKEVLNKPDYVKNQITWKTTLSAYRNGDFDGMIPAGAEYKDQLSISDHATSHLFNWEEDKVNLIVTDGAGKMLESGTDYELAETAEQVFTIRFTKAAAVPVTIQYTSDAAFGTGKGQKEIYNNKATLTVNNDVKSANASVSYNSNNIIKKSVASAYDPQTRSITWELDINKGKLDFAAGADVKIIDKLPKGLRVVSVKYKNGADISPSTRWNVDENGNLVIQFKEYLGEINRQNRFIRIVTAVDDISSLVDANGNVSFENEAGIYIGNDLMDSSSVTTSVKFEVLDKTAFYDKNSTARVVDYTAIVNGAGAVLGQNSENLIFKDQMDSNMSLVAGSLRVINTVTGFDITGECSLVVDTQNHAFTVEIPDATPLKITYRASFNSNEEKVSLKNTATLLASNGKIDQDVNESEFKVNQAQGSATANPDIILTKVDGENANMLLAGAKFSLYKLKSGVEPEKASDSDWTLSRTDIVSGAKGEISISNIDANAFYYVVETEAPNGYVCDESLRYPFIFIENIKGQKPVQVPEGYNVITQRKTGFYIANNKPQLAIEKLFYDADGEVLASKELDGVYYFAVYQNGVLAKTASGKNAVGSITVKDGVVVNRNAGKYPLVFDMEKSDTPYTVYESDSQGNILRAEGGANYIQTANGMKFIANGDGVISTEVKIDDNAVPAVARIENKLLAQPQQMKLKVHKTLTGKELEGNDFNFSIIDQESQIVSKGTNDKNGNVVFEPISYTLKEVGLHTYTVMEEQGSLAGITYSDAKFTLSVSVEKKDGKVLIKEVKLDDNVIKQDTEGIFDAVQYAEFENTYVKQEVLLDISGRKTLVNRENPLQNEEFSFSLSGAENAPLRVKTSDGGYTLADVLNAKNNADGVFGFSSLYYFTEDLGGEESKTFEYVIKEQLPNGVNADNPVKDGISYDTAEKKLEITLTKNADGYLNVKAVLDGKEYSSDNAELLTFTNTYNAEGSLSLKAVKSVTGTELMEQKFQFTATKYKKDGDTWKESKYKEKAENQFNETSVSKTVNNNGSDIDFGEDHFELSDIGEYRYIIEEMDTTLGGFSKDASKFGIYVTVSDNSNGTLSTIVEGIYKLDSEGNPAGDKLDQAEFVNTYKASGSLSLTVQKKLIGKELVAGQFTFKLEAANNVNWEAEDFDLSKVTFTEAAGNTAKANDSKGHVAFDPITYDQEGLYVYRITENIPAEANESNGYKADGYTYSTDPVYVYVKVSDAGDGTLKAETFSTNARDAYNGVITNTYEANGEVVLNGTKNLTGHKLEEGQFEFTLEMARAEGDTRPSEEAYELIANVKNDADGKFTFPAQKFAISGTENKNDTGVYFYRIKEVVPDTIPEGYQFLSDGIQEYIVKVLVEDAGGTLKITKTMEDGSQMPSDGVVFNNSYEAKGQWKPEALKVLTGSPLADGQFAFELLKGSSVIQTVTNKGDGTVSFDEITFTQKDMQNQKEMDLVYYIREAIPSEAEAGITYDRTLYRIELHLKDTDNGAIDVTRSIFKILDDTEEKVNDITFTNTFLGSASLLKTEEDGKTPLSGVVFELYAANTDGVYDLLGTYSTGADGRIEVSGLAANQYYFVETQAPEGYLIQKDSDGNPLKYTFTIGVDSGTGKVSDAVVHYTNTVVNGKGYGTAALTKYDGNDKQTTLAGVQFSLYTSQGALVSVKENSQGSYTYSGSTEDSLSVMTTGSDGRITVAGLPWGSYYFREVQALDGYILSETQIPFTVNADSFEANGTPVVIQVSALNQKTAITIEKVDEEGKGLEGATLEIRDYQTKEIIETWISDGKPHIIQGKLAVGKTYYLTEQNAPSGYELASDQEFTVPKEGRITVTMIDRKKASVYGSLIVTKKVSMVTDDMSIADANVKDYTIYVGLFTDSKGQNPYGSDYVKAIHIENGSSGSVSYSNLSSGTYYVFETDAQGNKIPFNEMQTDSYGSFICTVDGSGSVQIDTEGTQVSGVVALNNIYYDFPDGFDRSAVIDITKKVLKNGETFTADDTFYAGIFTLASDGTYQLLENMVHELTQNGTITVEVPLGGEDGKGEITYYVKETDSEGNPVSEDKSFKYHVSGEGEVTFDQDNTKASFTITNETAEEGNKKGSLNITKKVSMVSAEDGIVEAYVKDYTIYVGLFTDEQGLHPYDGDSVKAVHIENGSSGAVSYSNLPSGTYYVFETDAQGNKIPFDELQKDGYGSYICTVDGSGSVQIDTAGNQVSGTVALNNVYYEFPDGFSRNAFIDISKRVLKNGQSFTADDTFYAGIFTLDSDGAYELMENMVYELTQNGTITVEVPLDGEDGEGQVSYYIMETDVQGNPVSTDESFKYDVSGEGEVTLDADNTKAALTITNETTENAGTTVTPAPTRTPAVSDNAVTKAAVKTGDTTNIWSYLLLLAAAAGVIGILGYKRRKREQ